jgi:hypothetical protein
MIRLRWCSLPAESFTGSRRLSLLCITSDEVAQRR